MFFTFLFFICFIVFCLLFGYNYFFPIVYLCFYSLFNVNSAEVHFLLGYAYIPIRLKVECKTVLQFPFGECKPRRFAPFTWSFTICGENVMKGILSINYINIDYIRNKCNICMCQYPALNRTVHMYISKGERGEKYPSSVVTEKVQFLSILYVPHVVGSQQWYS